MNAQPKTLDAIRTGGCLYQIFWLSVLGFAIMVIALSWPVSGWLGGLLVVLWLLGRRENPWTKSARKVLQPIIWALCVLAVLQFIYNASLPEEHATTIAEIEGYIADLATALPKWLKLPWWGVCFLLVIVMLLNALKPQAKLVSKFLKGKKILSRVAAVLATLACFSFFAPETFRPHIVATRTKIRARMVALEKEKAAAKAQHVVLNRFRVVMEQLSHLQRAHLIANFQVITAISREAPAARAVALNLANSHWNALTPVPAEVDLPNSVLKSSQPLPDKIQTVSYSTLQRYEKELALQHAANSEFEKGLKRVFAETVGAATDSLKDIAFEYIGALIGLESNELLHQTQRYFDLVADTYFDKVKDPLIDKAVARLRTVWENLGENNMAVDETLSVAIQTRNAATNEAIALATAAKDEAAGISGKSGEEAISAAARVEANAQRASDLASIANNLMPETLLNADNRLAKAGTGLIIADTAAILKDTKTAVQSARAAAIAAKEAAVAARAAKEAADAAKAAKSLTNIVKAIPK
jgi:hypothetical protein